MRFILIAFLRFAPCVFISFMAQLNDVELITLQYLARGFTSQQIAGKIHRSPRTVEGIRIRIHKYFDIENVLPMLTYATITGHCDSVIKIAAISSKRAKPVQLNFIEILFLHQYIQGTGLEVIALELNHSVKQIREIKLVVFKKLGASNDAHLFYRALTYRFIAFKKVDLLSLPKDELWKVFQKFIQNDSTLDVCLYQLEFNFPLRKRKLVK